MIMIMMMMMVMVVMIIMVTVIVMMMMNSTLFCQRVPYSSAASFHCLGNKYLAAINIFALEFAV